MVSPVGQLRCLPLKMVVALLNAISAQCQIIRFGDEICSSMGLRQTGLLRMPLSPFLAGDVGLVAFRVTGRQPLLQRVTVQNE